MLPNLVTLLALCAGMTAMRLGFAREFRAATLAIVVAGILDGLDGRIARLLHATSAFGTQLDSLSDLVCFGIAPAFIVYVWTVSDLAGFGWVFTVAFGACCALRLARFNTQTGQAAPRYARRFFTGVPAPAGAGLAMVPMFLNFETGAELFRAPMLNGAMLVVVAGLMISRVPTFSIKNLRVPIPIFFAALFTAGGCALLLGFSVWSIFLATGVLYVSSIPVSICAFRLIRRRENTARRDQETAGARHAP